MEAIKKNRVDVDMTEGGIAGHLIRFALPLLVGNLFQMLYNLVDTWVVGNYVSDTAFSAVGTLSPVTNLMIGFFMGLSSGAGVIISRYFGAGRQSDVKRTVGTALVMTAALAVLFTVVGVLCVPLFLELLNMPDTVRPEAATYLTIWFSGISGLMIYNIGAGIMRAVGDSRSPFIFLVVCAGVNTVLDLLFVLVFGMGVEGVALATVIAQGVSAVLVIILLLTTESCVRVNIRRISFDFSILWDIVVIGFPAALQMTITSFSNIFVQSYINHFGDACMGGWSAYSKIDPIVLLPMQSLALASTTFVGQNLGKGRVERAKKGISTALLMSLCTTAVLILPVVIFSGFFVGIFNDNPEIVDYGVLFLRYLTPFYLCVCFNQIYAGALRGSGNTTAPMVIMLASFVGFRQLYLFVVTSFISNTILPVAMSFPAGWLLATVLTLIYYKITGLSRGRFSGSAVVQKEEKCHS